MCHFHFTLVIVYIYCILDLHSSVASVIFPVHRPLIYYSLHLRRRGLCMNLPLLWQECRDAFLQETFTAHSGSMKTLHAYASELRNFFACSNKSPERCTRQDVISYMARPNAFARRQGQPPAPGTRNHRLVVIRRFYEYASRYTVSDGYGKPQKLFSGENPAVGIRRVKIEHRPSYLTEDEIMRFFAAIDRQTVIGKRDYALFLTLF